MRARANPTKLLAVFVVDTDDKELTIPVNKATSRSKKVSNRLDYNQVASVGIKALGGVYGSVMQSSLPTVLVNLAYLRVSQINNCAYCLDTHTRDLVRKGQNIEKIALVQA
jgi:AhpD family alkylhydroperoxidase